MDTDELVFVVVVVVALVPFTPIQTGRILAAVIPA
jgi:hypothetical protein